MDLLQMSCEITWAQRKVQPQTSKNAVRGQKNLSEAKEGMKVLIYWKKGLIRVALQPQKPLSGSNQI